MKTVLAGVAAVALLAGAPGAFAQTTTTAAHETDDAGSSKTAAHHAVDSKTAAHHHAKFNMFGMFSKKAHTTSNGDKTTTP